MSATSNAASVSAPASPAAPSRFDPATAARSLRLEGTCRIDDWLAGMEALERHLVVLRARAKEHSRYKKWILIVVWLAVPVVFFFLGPPAGVGMLAAAVAASVALRWVGRAPPDMPRIKMVAGLLSILAPDIDPAAKVRLDVDLGDVATPKKMTGSEALDPKVDARATAPRTEKGLAKSGFKVKRSVYVDPWLTATIPLGEGVRLQIRQVERAVKFDKSWRNPRGKSKSKFKFVRRTLFGVRVVAPAARFAVAQRRSSLADTQLAVTPDGEHIRVEARRVLKRQGLEPNGVNPRRFAEVVGLACSQLEPVQTLRRTA